METSGDDSDQGWPAEAVDQTSAMQRWLEARKRGEQMAQRIIEDHREEVFGPQLEAPTEVDQTG